MTGTSALCIRAERCRTDAPLTARLTETEAKVPLHWQTIRGWVAV